MKRCTRDIIHGSEAKMYPFWCPEKSGQVKTLNFGVKKEAQIYSSVLFG